MGDPAADLIKTDLLIVGAGPAGASLACFLGQHGQPQNDRPPVGIADSIQGRSGIMIAAAPGTAETPRAHITNMAGLGRHYIKAALSRVR